MTELTAAVPRPGAVRRGSTRSAAWPRSGAQLCFGSDWPVSSPNPLWEMHTAVNRTTAPGLPLPRPGHRHAVPARRADRPARRARRVHHRLCLRQPRRARDAGSVEAGKRADLVVLDRDLFAQPAAEIALAEVDLTLVDGTVVHARPGT